jgi:hypothetical protein
LSCYKALETCLSVSCLCSTAATHAVLCNQEDLTVVKALTQPLCKPSQRSNAKLSCVILCHDITNTSIHPAPPREPCRGPQQEGKGSFLPQEKGEQEMSPTVKSGQSRTGLGCCLQFGIYWIQRTRSFQGGKAETRN